MKRIRVIQAEGSSYEIGLEIGKQTKKEIAKLLSKTERVSTDKKEITDAYKGYLEHLRKFPAIIDELNGIADGAGVSFDSIARLNITELERHKRDDACSTVIVMADDKFIVGHNEDGNLNDDVYILRVKFPDGTRMVSLNYYGSLMGIAVNINSHGLIMLCNALKPSDAGIGLPKRAVDRLLAGCKSINGCINLLEKLPRASGQNFVLINGDEAVSVETSAKKTSVNKIKKNYYHCNNYLEQNLKHLEALDRGAGSFKRSGVAARMVSSLGSLDDIRELLSSHENQPMSICVHEYRDMKTLASVFIDLNNKSVLVGHGNPCMSVLEELNVGFDW